MACNLYCAFYSVSKCILYFVIKYTYFSVICLAEIIRYPTPTLFSPRISAISMTRLGLGARAPPRGYATAVDKIHQ